MAVWWPAKAIVDPFVSCCGRVDHLDPARPSRLGIGEQQKVATSSWGRGSTSWSTTLAAAAGRSAAGARRAYLGARDLAVMTQVILPAALPGILAGLEDHPGGLRGLRWRPSPRWWRRRAAWRADLAGQDWGNLALVLVGMVGISITVGVLVADAVAELIWEAAAAVGAVPAVRVQHVSSSRCRSGGPCPLRQRRDACTDLAK